MTVEEMKILLDMTEYPVAYSHFPRNYKPSIPYICFLSSGQDNFYAENKVWHSSNTYSVELYTSKKEPDIELKLERLFEDMGLTFEKGSDTYIPEEDLFLIEYELST